MPGQQPAGRRVARSPSPVEEPSGPDFFRSPAGLAIGLGLLALAVVAIAFSVGSSFFGDDSSLRQALQPYSEGYVADPDSDDDDGGDGKGQHLAQTPLLQRAVEATGTFAEKRGFLTKVESMLERANLAAAPAGGALLLRRRRRRGRAAALRGGRQPHRGADRHRHRRPSSRRRSCSYLGNRRRKQFEAHPPRHPPAAGQHPAGRLLAHAGRGGGVAGGVRADGPGAPPGRHRGPPRPPPRGGARRRRRAHGVRRLRLGGHGDPHPAGGRRQPGRAAASPSPRP